MVKGILLGYTQKSGKLFKYYDADKKLLGASIKFRDARDMLVRKAITVWKKKYR